MVRCGTPVIPPCKEVSVRSIRDGSLSPARLSPFACPDRHCFPLTPVLVAVRIAKPIAWTLLAILAVVLLLFSLVGILHTFRGTPISRVHVAGTGGATLDVADVSFRTAAEALTGTPILSGNDVEILLNDEVLRRLYADLRSARRSIAIRNYYALPGAVADTLANIQIAIEIMTPRHSIR